MQRYTHFLLAMPGGRNSDSNNIFPASYIPDMSGIFFIMIQAAEVKEIAINYSSLLDVAKKTKRET